MFGGKGTGGGSGGHIIRTAGRAVARAAGGLQDPFSSTAAATATRPSSPTSSSRSASHRHGGSANFHGLSSSPSQSHNHCPVAASWPFCNRYCDEFEWISVDGNERENAAAKVSEDGVGWSVPSLDEVHGAVAALDQVFGEGKDEGGRVGKYMSLVNRVDPIGSEVDWVEPRLELQLGGRGVEKVYDAFHLLHTDPSVQRMVMSVSCDKAVWDAIMNNEAVQHLRNSFSEAKDESTQNSEESSPDKPSDESTNIIRWIFEGTKTKVVEVIERITVLANQLFQNGNNGDNETRAEMDPFEEKLRTSLFISIVVLLVVMVSRAHMASL